MKYIDTAVNSIVRYVNLAVGQEVLSTSDRTLSDIITLAIAESKRDDTPQKELATDKDNNTE